MERANEDEGYCCAKAGAQRNREMDEEVSVSLSRPDFIFMYPDHVCFACRM